ncbi:MAG TPA: sugar phosphate nucleotidyltransferase, partial [Microthrixaceae bacterium]|nr:sugar phosphate nucleotidyltransferase [Microthrixaceae bacterium]
DAPLLRSSTIAALVAQHRQSGSAATLLSAVMDDPTGYGRVIRSKDGNVVRIVEQSDGTDEELAVKEVNTSIYIFRRSLLTPALRRVEPDNNQGEYYLTDVIGVLSGAGHRVDSMVVDDAAEVQGINDRVQLAAAEAELRRRTNDSLLRSGVTIVDPSAVYVDTTVEVARDVTLFPGVILQGATVIGSGTEVGPNSHLVDTTVGVDCELRSTVAVGTKIGDRSVVGPFASLVAGDELPSDSITGPFYTASRGQ